MTEQEAIAQAFENGRKKGDAEGYARGLKEAVRHGRWVKPYINRYGHPCHCCSECGFKASYQDKKYCPNCGARMDLEV